MSIVRPCGRSFDEIRPVKIDRHFTNNSQGSVLISIGNTIVLCTANIVEGVPDFIKGQRKGWLTAEYSMLPGSTNSRVSRESVVGKQNARTQEIQRFIGRSLRSAFDLSFLGDNTIRIDCDVLQADGGTRCISITGAYIAVIEAISWFNKKYTIINNPIVENIAAISVGIVDNNILLDMNYEEDSNCEVDMNIVMSNSGNFIEIQSSSEKKTFDKRKLDLMLSLAEKGILELISYY
ncbi:ribonuclease PH [Candidatus Kinetoplastidibacterium desouzai]|nr:ribonuclease PH [Candidatus Kinetoplastibacterium desouzaii]